jgi:ubiquinone/menaquinone biosynthesis C-methylase UbiE
MSVENPMQRYEASINGQYGQPDLGAELLVTLQGAGKDINALTPDDLAPFEEIHIRGREATRALAQLSQLREGMEVLDVGCGVGGPARTLASEFGCQLTGIDLTENYCLAAEMLTARVGLADRVIIHQGNALDMPFDDDSFDAVWMQHMAMNIENKVRLFGEVRRVLRPDGRLVLHEIGAGSAAPPYFPVPWASKPSISYLIAPAKLRQLLAAAGFRELSWLDDTQGCIEWYQALFAARTPGAPPPIGLELVLGSDFPEKGRNVLRNMEDDRIAVLQAVFECTE